MRKTLLVVGCILLLSSCQRGCQKAERRFQSSDRKYEVTMYSGGEVVFKDTFTGIMNESESSDGMFYFKADTLIEVSGDYIVKSIK